MRLDPAYPLLAKLLHDSNFPLWDVGCGPGVFAAYLREHGVQAPLWGVDISAQKIALAQKWVASRYPHTHFAVGDAATCFPQDNHEARNIVVLDVLHYFSDEERRQLLEKWVSALGAGGRLFLRNGVRDISRWRHGITQIEELWVRGSRWIHGGAWNFPSRVAVEEDLRQAGARAVVSMPLWGQTPFSSYFFVAARF